MMKVQNFAAVVALSALAALPGCSMFGGNKTAETAPPPAETAPAPAPAPAPMASNPAQNALSHSLVRKVQMVLRHDHMYHMRIDGIYGPGTRHGVMEFQRRNGIEPTGQLNDATLTAMNLTAPMNENAMSGEPMNGGSMNGGSMNNEMGGNAMSAAPAPAEPAPAEPAPPSKQ